MWDKAGNLTQRQDNNQGLTENAYYDNLYRLDYTTLNGSTNLDLSYAANGNIQSLSGVGSYTYHATKLHAVASINTGGGTLSYSYDGNGNLTSRNGTTLTWFVSNLPKSIVKDSANSSTFQYGPSGQRWQQVYLAGGVTATQLYLGALMEKVTQGGAVDWRHYIFAVGQAVAVYSRKSSGVNTLSYLLRDALGSVDVIASSTGAVTVRESFGAFGQRRGTAWSGVPSSGDLSTINGLTRRGYTGHEMLDSTDLIHMNGRVYDPFIARFVSADPFVSRALSSQGWNRYSYVMGNPLSAVDPSGFTDNKVVRQPINGDNIADCCVEIVQGFDGRETAMVYGRQGSYLSDFLENLSIIQLLDVPHPGGGRYREGGEGGGGGEGDGDDGELEVVEVTAEKPQGPKDFGKCSALGKTVGFSAEAQVGATILGGTLSIEVGLDVTRGQIYIKLSGGFGIGLGLGAAAGVGGAFGTGNGMTYGGGSRPGNTETGSTAFGGVVSPGGGALISGQMADGGGGSAPLPPYRGGRGHVSLGGYAGAYAGPYGSIGAATGTLFCDSGQH